ncbi:MAG: hypothetical protein OXG46_09395 [Chloroflexi bacterium]|nr:hypothetical protein [Chloroflexota bacterium]MCY3939400.1 hypothetical protein [Chloroflexota bacterium]
MTSFVERDLQITFNNVKSAQKIDGPSHMLGHCMKAVDFVVELPNCYLYVEFKDPQDPESTDERRQEFVSRFLSGQLDRDFVYKYRDSFLYEWASGKADKPIRYFVLIALDSLDSAALLRRTDALKRQLPLDGPKSNSWTRPIVEGCEVFNIDKWNSHFSDYPIIRLSSHTTPAGGTP